MSLKGSGAHVAPSTARTWQSLVAADVPLTPGLVLLPLYNLTFWLGGGGEAGGHRFGVGVKGSWEKATWYVKAGRHKGS